MRNTAKDDRAAGKSHRSEITRSEHAGWKPDRKRANPLKLIAQDERGRIEELLPIRRQRMADSPFGFLRGAVSVMCADLATMPPTGIEVQLCGDAHLSNFGLHATPERSLVFDVNDFDETLPGPFEWDLKRLAASTAVLAIQRGASRKQAGDMVAASMGRYRKEIARFAAMPALDVFYATIDVDKVSKSLTGKAGQVARATITKARKRTNLQAFEKLTEIHRGRRRIADDPPLVEHIDGPGLGYHFGNALNAYRESLAPPERKLVGRYRFVDWARKVVGMGSIGTHCDVILLIGATEQDPLLLQAKEAGHSALEPYLGRSRYRQQGKRVVMGRRMIQATSDVLLGWLRVDRMDIYVRQLRDMKGAAEVEAYSPALLADYAAACAAALALGHARSGSAAQIAGYLGSSDRFDRAISEFALDYERQNAADYREFLATQ